MPSITRSTIFNLMQHIAADRYDAAGEGMRRKRREGKKKKRIREKEKMKKRSLGLLWINYDSMVWVPLRYAMSVVKVGLAGRKEGSN